MFSQGLYCLLLISIAAAFEKCGIRQSESNDLNDRIVDGSETDPGEYPWMVSVQIYQYEFNEFQHVCGGSVLDEHWILTAAHCLSETKIQIVAGEHNLENFEGPEQRIDVEEIFEHPEWNSQTVHNDIALLKLSSPLNLTNRFVSPVCLPDHSKKVLGPCVVTGWGLTKEGGKLSPTLREVSLPVVSGDLCLRNYKNFIDSFQICAGYFTGGKDTCNEDSGGPFVCQNEDEQFYLAGIVSYGEGCARPNMYGVYTRVSSYLDWIEQVRMDQKNH